MFSWRHHVKLHSGTSWSLFSDKNSGAQEKESINHGEGKIEKSVPRDHRLSSLGKPRDANRRSLGRIFLSYPHTHDRFLYSIFQVSRNSYYWILNFNRMHRRDTLVLFVERLLLGWGIWTTMKEYTRVLVHSSVKFVSEDSMLKVTLKHIWLLTWTSVFWIRNSSVKFVSEDSMLKVTLKLTWSHTWTSVFWIRNSSVKFVSYNSMLQGSQKPRKSWKTLKITKKSSMHGKIMVFENTLNNHGKIMEFCEIILRNHQWPEN